MFDWLLSIRYHRRFNINFWILPFISLSFQNMLNLIIWKVLQPNHWPMFLSRQRSVNAYGFVLNLLHKSLLWFLNIDVFFVNFLLNQLLVRLSYVFIILLNLTFMLLSKLNLFELPLLLVLQKLNRFLIDSSLRISLWFCVIGSLKCFLKQLLTIQSLRRRYYSLMNNIST